MGRRPTIADVAREAGVSPSTASVVFSGTTAVTDATRARVLAAATTLGYTGPDPRAASLRRGRSGIVGVVIGEHLSIVFLDPVARQMMDGIADGVASIGAGLLLLRDDGSGREPSLTSAPIDAAVLIGSNARLRDSLSVVAARGIPVVVLEGPACDGMPRVGLDDREAEREIGRHLRHLGHVHVVTVTLPLDAERTPGWAAGDDIVLDVPRERLRGVRDVYPDAGVYAAAESSIDQGLAAGRVILASDDRPTAIIAQSDLLAAGLVRAAEEAGLRVPADVSITGFDGIVVDGLAPYELTTMVQPAVEKGRAAGSAVVAMLAGEAVASVDFTCTFRAGNTTGPAPRG
jgi:DNA-binding LacI/PurR family transcriptional regulator